MTFEEIEQFTPEQLNKAAAERVPSRALEEFKNKALGEPFEYGPSPHLCSPYLISWIDAGYWRRPRRTYQIKRRRRARYADYPLHNPNYGFVNLSVI